MKIFPIPEATSPLATWLSHLARLHPQAIEMGLDRIRRVACEMNLAKPAPFVFMVAGTNGKGTTCRTMEMLLIAAGYRVGVYSSPHLISYTERVRIQGEELAESLHTASFSEVEVSRGNISLTFFEYSTLSALKLFMDAKLDVVILEVGLGGRLDATNIVDADMAIITTIALDHTDRLGCDRESIGREKAGIFRQDKAAVIGESEMPDSIAEVAKSTGTMLLRRNHDWTLTSNGDVWTFSDARGELCNLPLPQVPVENAATALAALRASGLNVSEEIIRRHIQQVQLAGRFQIIQRSPRIIMDVAHNPHAAAWLAAKLAALNPLGKVHVVVGMLLDKDIPGTLANLLGIGHCWYCATLEEDRGASAELLRSYLPSGKCYKSVEQAWQAAIAQAGDQDIVLVCGSFHTVSQVMKII